MDGHLAEYLSKEDAQGEPYISLGVPRGTPRCFRGLVGCSSSVCRTVVFWDSSGLDSTFSNSQL